MDAESLNPEQKFSRKAIKKALSGETVSNERTTELNALAKQVAEQFAADAISPHLITGLVRLDAVQEAIMGKFPGRVGENNVAALERAHEIMQKR